MAELADALDLGSSVSDVQVQVLLSAVNKKCRMPVNKAFPVLFCCLNIGKVAKRWQIIKL